MKKAILASALMITGVIASGQCLAQESRPIDTTKENAKGLAIAGTSNGVIRFQEAAVRYSTVAPANKKAAIEGSKGCAMILKSAVKSPYLNEQFDLTVKQVTIHRADGQGYLTLAPVAIGEDDTGGVIFSDPELVADVTVYIERTNGTNTVSVDYVMCKNVALTQAVDIFGEPVANKYFVSIASLHAALGSKAAIDPSGYGTFTEAVPAEGSSKN
jgi:hypothetical protein